MHLDLSQLAVSAHLTASVDPIFALIIHANQIVMQPQILHTLTNAIVAQQEIVCLVIVPIIRASQHVWLKDK